MNDAEYQRMLDTGQAPCGCPRAIEHHISNGLHSDHAVVRHTDACGVKAERAEAVAEARAAMDARRAARRATPTPTRKGKDAA